MKRVGLSRFRPLDVSRTVQQCLRFEGVNSANGVNNSDSEEGDSCPETGKGADAKVCVGMKSSNLLTTIRRKLRRPKRSGGFRCENCELIGGCPRHLKPRRQKCDKNAWSSSVLRCQNHQNSSRSEDVAELISSLAEDSSEDCSCFVSPPPEDADQRKPGSELVPRASSSLSDLSDAEDTDPPPKEDPETGVRSALDSAESTSTSCLCPSHSNSCNNNNDHEVACCVEEPAVYEAPRVRNLTSELQKLSKYGWYWGPITRIEAESKLVDQPDGAFLVRDSSDDRYILSLSFRSFHKTFHTRIEHSSCLFSFYSQPEPGGHASIVELVNMSMSLSQSGVLCYSRSRSPGAPSIPVRLTKPVSRFTQVRSLQYLCRFLIRQYTRYDHIQKLPLPPRVKGYLEEGHY